MRLPAGRLDAPFAPPLEKLPDFAPGRPAGLLLPPKAGFGFHPVPVRRSVRASSLRGRNPSRCDPGLLLGRAPPARGLPVLVVKGRARPPCERKGLTPLERSPCGLVPSERPPPERSKEGRPRAWPILTGPVCRWPALSGPTLSGPIWSGAIRAPPILSGSVDLGPLSAFKALNRFDLQPGWPAWGPALRSRQPVAAVPGVEA